ncbi:MAG: nitrilase-related carbon-nitrogen hydrolase, partial [Pseudomonadota bacterium]
MVNAPDSLKIALAQLNPRVGDIQGNIELARKARAEAAAMGADLVLFSELFVTGYPPEDLVLKRSFNDTARQAVEAIAEETADGGPALLIGVPWRDGDALYNAVALLDEGKIA